MEPTQLCAMCKRAPLADMSTGIEQILEELASSFELARNHFHGDMLCSDCTKICVLTHHVQIRKRKQAEEQRASKQGNQASSGRRPSVGQSEHKLSLATRMRLALEAARNRELQFARNNNETKENLCVNLKDEMATGSSDE